MAGLVKAQLIEIDFGKNGEAIDKPAGSGQSVTVQFNPETLKVSFANEIKTPGGGDQKSGTAGRQFVGEGTTKLALQLWFDVTAMEENPVDDVRRLTQKVVYFMTPQPVGSSPKKLPPGVRFLWGSFIFEGVVDSLEESLEFFSSEGKPLRANVSLTLSQQKILKADFKGDGKAPSTPGTKPLAPAKQGDSLPNMADTLGKGDWQGIAQANGIEDPMRLKPGHLIDLNVSVSSSGVALPRVDLAQASSVELGVSGSTSTTLG